MLNLVVHQIVIIICLFDSMIFKISSFSSLFFFLLWSPYKKGLSKLSHETSIHSLHHSLAVCLSVCVYIYIIGRKFTWIKLLEDELVKCKLLRVICHSYGQSKMCKNNALSVRHKIRCLYPLRVIYLHLSEKHDLR